MHERDVMGNWVPPRSRIEERKRVLAAIDADPNLVLVDLREPVEERAEAVGLEISGWWGHRRGPFNEVGRVHNKDTVHMDGCIPLFVETERA